MAVTPNLPADGADDVRPGIVARRLSFSRVVLCASIVLLAFNDLPTVLPVGELSQEAFVFAVPVLGLLLLRSRGGIVVPVSLVYFGTAFGLTVLLGIVANYGEISAAAFKGRTGFERIGTQGLTFSFGLLISVLYFNFARLGMTSAVAQGARLAVLVMAVFGLLEVASWYSIPGLTTVHTALSTIVHAGSGSAYPTRLRTTAFEVSWAGVVLTFFFPFATVQTEARKWAALQYAVLVGVLIVLSQSRTSLLVIGCQALILLWYAVRRRVDLLVYAMAVGCLCALVLATNTEFTGRAEEVLSNVAEYGRVSPPQQDGLDDNVSNITRAASVRAAELMAWERPLLGFGLGQFGFHYATHLSADDYRSYEVREYATDSSPIWPPAYSIHARLLAETGLLGYAIWLGFILVLLTRSLRAAVRRATDPRLAKLHLAVATTLVGVLLLGLSIDSFRFFGGWIAIGIAIGLPELARSRPD